MEKALHLTESTYKAMQERGYQCHAVLARETRQWGTAFMNRLAGGGGGEFFSIQHKDLSACLLFTSEPADEEGQSEVACGAAL